MDFSILGSLEVRGEGRPVSVTRPKQRALLAALVLRAGQVVSVDRLLDDLWGESPPPSARASLLNAVSMLRKLLGPDVLRTRPPGYMLDVDPEHVDHMRFERLVREAAGLAPLERAERLRDALDLWRGPALADLAFEPFAEVEVDRLEELRAGAREALAAAELELGEHEALVPRLEALVAEHPFRERPRAQLMLALYRSGRQAEALEAYAETRRFLDDQLGLEPGPALRQLQQAILRQDPRLDGPLRPLEAASAPAERRTTVTVLFADVVESTALAAELDAEAYRRVLERYYRTARAALERHGGTIEKFVGDAVVGVFGVPTRHEDDALRAVRAAWDLRERLRLNADVDPAYGATVRVRTGVNTGEAVVGDAGGRQSFATGYAVNVAAKLQHEAGPDEVLLGAATYRLVRDAVEVDALPPLELGGRAASIPAFRLTAVAPALEGVARRLEAPLVGRGEELASLRRAFDATRDIGRCRVVTVVGDAGIGKTRLARELAAAVREQAEVLVGRCVSYGEGATFLPLRDVVVQAAGDASAAAVAALLAGDEDAAAVARGLAGLVGGDAKASTGEGFWAVRRLLETLAADRPVLLTLDDAHWAEPTLLDLVDYLVDHAAGRILVLCLARPELLEARPGWAGDDRASLRLERLPEADARALVDGIGAALSDGVRARVTELAEGNPLFAEQLAAYAAEEGPGALDAVPATVEALLGSRIDLLPAAERAVLERAAVVGRDFWSGALDHLAAVDEPASDALRGLAERGLVRPVRSSLPREDGYRFHHVLVRDVVYASIPKRRRSALHERAADWLEQHDPGSDEIVGFHLEQAHRLRVDLGPPDGHARRLAADAGARLGTGGLRAFMRGDAPAAVNLLRRACALLPEREARRRELLCELGIALRATGALAAALDVLEQAVQASRAEGDRRLELRAGIELANLRLHHDRGSPRELLELVDAAVSVFEALDDHRSLGRAWLLKSLVQAGFSCRNADGEDAAVRALAHYRRTGWSYGTCVSALASALYYGPRPVDDALERCAALLGDAADATAEAELLPWMAGLNALAGRLDEARALVSRARARYLDLGRAVAVVTVCGVVDADIELLAGDLGRAETRLRETCAECERLHEWAFLGTLAAKVADVIHAQGRIDDAERWAHVARRHAAAEDVSAQFSWRAVQAKLLAARGRVEAAEAMSREAVRLVDLTDALDQRGQVLLDQARILLSAENVEGAERAAAEALHAFEEKGDVVRARAARALVGQLRAV